MNKEVSIFIYITEATFDAYSYQLVENKQKFISQIMTSKSPARSCEDLDEAALSYAEVKALAAGNPMIKEKMDLDIQVARLRTLKAAYNSQHYRLEDAVTGTFPREIRGTECRIQAFEKDMQTAKDSQSYDKDGKLVFSIELDGTTYAKLLEEKKKTYAEYRRSREEMRELLTAKANVDRVLKMEVEQDVEKEKDHDQR